MKLFKQLLENRVLVKPKEISNKTESGIIIPDTAMKKPQRGIVIGVGNGYVVKEGERAGLVLPMTVKEGDEVLFQEDAGMELEVENEKVLLMLETSIDAII